MSEVAAEKACAKLNISLDVGAKRPDGYHDMVMVMQTVSLCDAVSIRKAERPGVRSYCDLPYIPTGEKNLATRAAMAYLERIGHPEQGIRIDIKKHIPVGAGMGGGSSDAAAVLRGMNTLYGNALSLDELEELAAGIGSDVPFCVRGGTALAKGRGEVLTALTAMPECRIVICKPDFSISTPELFKKLDGARVRRHPDTGGLLKALEDGDLKNVCRRMYNVFEDLEDRRMRVTASIKSTMLDHGALGAVMTGTGSAVFGVFEPDAELAELEKILTDETGFCEIAECVKRL